MMHLSSSASRRALCCDNIRITISDDYFRFGIVIFKWHSLKLGELLGLQH